MFSLTAPTLEEEGFSLDENVDDEPDLLDLLSDDVSQVLSGNDCKGNILT